MGVGLPGDIKERTECVIGFGIPLFITDPGESNQRVDDN